MSDITNPIVLSSLLGDRLGHPVILDKIANRIVVCRSETVGVKLCEVVEQELLAAVDPIEFIVEKATEELEMPEVVYVPREAMQRSVTFFKLEVGEGELRYQLDGAALLPTEQGPVSLMTISSEPHLDLRLAKNELISLITVLKTLYPGSGPISLHPHSKRLKNKVGVSTVVIVDELRTYQDSVTKKAQAWFDGAVLPGVWEWDEDQSQLVCKEAV